MLYNIFKVILSNFTITIIGIVNSFVFPILMSIQDYAYYQLFTLYVSYASICQLGIASGMFINYGGKDYRSIDKSRYKSEIYLILIVLSCFTVLVYAVSYIIDNPIVFLVATVIIPFCIVGSYKALFQAWNKFTEYSLINALPNVLITIIALLIYIVTKELQGIKIVYIFIFVNCIVCIILLKFFLFSTKTVKSKKIFSRQNFETTKIGFLVTLGNYVNLLFHSIDKQFVIILFSTHSFAMYSFAMSTQNIMTVFITALSQPLYPKLAKGDFSKDQLNILKELLLMFGSLSGCAYFVISFAVENFIAKYIDSLVIIGIFFAVFPAMAVINVLYINLYKVTRQINRYIFTLIGILLVSIILNFIAITFKYDYIFISLATLTVYYIWLFYSQRDFNDIIFTIKDIIYLVGFFILYFTCTRMFPSIIGFIIYGLVVLLWNFTIYKSSIKHLISVMYKKFVKSKIYKNGKKK